MTGRRHEFGEGASEAPLRVSHNTSEWVARAAARALIAANAKRAVESDAKTKRLAAGR